MKLMARILTAVVALVLGVSGGTAIAAQSSTTTANEAYPPTTVFLGVIEPSCSPAHVDGSIRQAKANSTVEITITQGGTVIGTATVTTDGSGNATFSITIPAGTVGTVTVTASGLRQSVTGTPESGNFRYQPTDQPFTLSQDVVLTVCAPLPDTGSSLTVPLVRIAGVAVIGGLLMLVVGIRRRQRQTA